MEKSQHLMHGAASTDVVSSAARAFFSPGRRGVRIFGWPHKRLVMATVASLVFGIPFVFVVAMIPFWDRIGDFGLLKILNSYVAPAIDGLSYDHRSMGFPQFPLKRFMIASMTMVELVFLTNFVALFVHSVRKHALMVWVCHDRKKIFRYFAISFLIFCGLWYVLFFDWRTLAFLSSGGVGRRLIPFLVIAMPVAAVVCGHLAAIVGLGVYRSTSQRLRRLRVRLP
jgi:hypothetical protein